jgi:hypothetical protein
MLAVCLVVDKSDAPTQQFYHHNTRSVTSEDYHVTDSQWQHWETFGIRCVKRHDSCTTDPHTALLQNCFKEQLRKIYHMVVYFKFLNAARAKNSYSGVGAQFTRPFRLCVTQQLS